MTPSSRTLPHVGEWKVRLRADTLEDIFAAVARSVARRVGTSHGPAGDWEEVTVAARDRIALLVDWANELIGRSEVAGRAYSEVRNIAIAREGSAPLQLRAEVRGTPIREWLSPLKAATYHDAIIECVNGHWRAELLFDV